MTGGLAACGTASPTATTSRPNVAAAVTLPSTTTTTIAVTPPVVAWKTTTVQLTYGGLFRSYLISRPATTSATPLPVLVELDGSSITPAAEEQRSGFLTTTGPAILVYPAGVGESWNAGACCHVAQTDNVDDVGFITAVVQRVLAGQPDAAANQVYLAGYSNVAKMAFRMACAEPQLFAGIATYGAVNTVACPNTPPVSILVAASTGDPETTIGPGGAHQSINGYTEPTVVEQVAQYVQADTCGAPQSSTEGSLTITSTSCSGGRVVQQAIYQGGDHGWPTGNATTPSVQQVMWTFFRSLSTGSS
jgi:polyhydroxybutyrate depolymerase